MRKGQAAMEFIMTYGWAILVVLVAIAALAYFGVLSPEKFLPEKCTLPAGLYCKSSKVAAASTELIIQNSLGKDIVVTGISMPGAGATGCSGTYNTTVVNGGEDTFTITCALTAGSKLNSDLTVTYDEVLGLTGLTTTGTITKKVQ